MAITSLLFLLPPHECWGHRCSPSCLAGSVFLTSIFLLVFYMSFGYLFLPAVVGVFLNMSVSEPGILISFFHLILAQFPRCKRSQFRFQSAS